MPAGLIDQEHRMGSWCDHLGDFREMEVHCFGVAGRQDQGRALTLFGANGTEDVGRRSALIAGSTRTGAAFGPPARDLVLLADTPRLYMRVRMSIVYGVCFSVVRGGASAHRWVQGYRVSQPRLHHLTCGRASECTHTRM